jgi:PAS domain-containing protein
MQMILDDHERPPREVSGSDPAHGRYYTQGPVKNRSRTGEDLGRPRGRWGSRLLYLGVFLLAGLVLLAALSFRREWQERIGQSRSDAIFQLVQGRTPARPTETPGAAAWLNLELRRYRERIADPERARLYGEVAEWQDSRSVPPFFAPIREVLARPLAPPPTTEMPGALRLVTPQALGEGGGAAASLRSQNFLELDRHWFAVTRRKSLESGDPENPSNRFLARVTPRLLGASRALAAALVRHPLPALPGSRPPRVARLYALSEDGTLVTLPFPPLQTAPFDPEASRRAALAEGRELRSSPERPTFVSNEFYFRFDFADPREQTFYSGLYLDLGGQGLVATITVPLRDTPGSPGSPSAPGIAGADLTFDIDWEAFARRIDPPMVAGVVHLAGPTAGARHWTDLASAAAGSLPPALQNAIAALARRPAVGSVSVSESVPNVLHGVVEGQGAVAAFQVAAATWLIVLFPKTQSHLPLIPVLLSAILLVTLLAGFERNRRRAERAFTEKQNLLNTMQVPLIVVDPNTDEVVFGNQAAEKLGLRPGERIGDLVAPDPRARAHYERMQVARPEPRRAYGVPVRVRGEDGNLEERYAIVRSVAVTAPIEALHADERHRLGILFLVEPEADLALWTADLTSATREDERRRLVGLLAHGADTLVRVLAHSLGDGSGGVGVSGADSSPGFVAWLAGYLDRRLRTTAWLLDHWDAEPPLPPDSSIEAAQARATLESLATVFSRVARDADLRTRLHWDNGVLCLRPDPQAPVFTLEIDWPEEYWFACPVRGGFGFFLGEVLINAIRHGRPGSTPTLRVTLDRVRRELAFEVENEVSEGAPDRAEDDGEAYGGQRILERLARLFEWRDLVFEKRAATYLVSWRVPASERGDPRRAD